MAEPTFPLPPLSSGSDQQDEDPAVNLIRTKLFQLYEAEPSASEEIKEIKQVGATSKHQQFLRNLSSSGKSVAEVQTAWHEYYQALTDKEKHEVWQEFYSNKSRQATSFDTPSPAADQAKPLPQNPKAKLKAIARPQNVAQLKQKLISRVNANGRLKAKHHLKSLLFGLGSAGLVGLIIIFVLFNQLFITPFITPSKTASATPLIIDPSGQVTVDPEPKIIIPKLNVEAPIVTDASDNEEETIQKALEKGVTLYPNTGKPGELSNPIIFGHSSNNIFNGGDYKFVFVMLSKLENGDTFMVNYNSKQYVYRVFNKKVVKPYEVSVLNEKPVPAMMTLITCDPPGSSANRLIVQAEQISPDPNGNLATSADPQTDEPAIIPSNAESLFQRIINWF